MKNRKIVKRLVALGIVTFVISDSLQIPLSALAVHPHSKYVDMATFENPESQIEDALHVHFENAMTDKYEANSKIGRFTITGTDSKDAELVLEVGRSDNDKFVIENNILKSKIGLVPGTSYILKVLCNGKNFTFMIDTPIEEEIATDDSKETIEEEIATDDSKGTIEEEIATDDSKGTIEEEIVTGKLEETGDIGDQLIDPKEDIEVIDQQFSKENVYENALVNYVFTDEERVFDGIKTIDKTVDIGNIERLNKGTIIIKAKLNPEMASENGMYPIIGFGSSDASETSNKKAQLVGVDIKGEGITPRYEFSDGLYSSCARDINYSDGQWHVLALVFDDQDIFVSGDGKTTLEGGSGHYKNSKFDGFLTRNTNMDSITIGGIADTKSNTNGASYKNWVGEIAQITITDQVLTIEQADALTLAGKNEAFEVILEGQSVDFGVEGAEVGTFSIKGEGAQTTQLTLKENTADNDKFIIEGNILKSKVALEAAQTYKVVVLCNGEEFGFTINSKIDTNLPIIHEESLLFFQDGRMNESEKDYNDAVVDQVKQLQDITLKLQFKQGQSGIGSLFSFSDGKQDSTHFHVYVNGSDIGYEMRVGGSNHSGKESKLRPNGVNTIAFKADSQNLEYKLFVNGELVITKEMTEETYKMASDITNLDTVSLGRTARVSGNTYPFTGLIGEAALVSTALSDEELITYTNQTETISKEALADQPFVAGDEFGSNFFRIPALTELQNGDIIAAMDIRFGSTFDSPNNLDTGVRVKRNGSWEGAQLVNHFADYTDEAGRPPASASFIDPAIVQDPISGRIYILADAFPSGGGLFGKYNNMYGNGMMKINDNGERVADGEEGDYYVGLVPKGRPLKSLMEMTHYVKPVESTNPDLAYEIIEIATNNKTNFTLNEKFEMFKSGVPLTTQQKRPNGESSGVEVPMSVFYETSDFLLYPVAYLWLVTSDDNGVTWNAPKLVANEFKTKEMRYFIAGPGRGLVIQNSDYAGRILFPMYSDLYGERSSAIYSDDQGVTWKHSEITTMTDVPGKSPGKSSEAQLIELPDGTVRMYARSNAYVNHVGYADSLDGGATFEPMQIDDGFPYASNVQLSVINYSRKIDGKDVIIFSAPEGVRGSNQRTKGRIHVGLINENPAITGYGKYDIDWKYQYEVNNTHYGYSCLAELSNGDIAVLYERDGDKPFYEEIPMDRILGKAPKPGVAYINLGGQLVGGRQVDLVISTKERVVQSLSDLQNSTLSITFEGIGESEKTATFKEISSTGTRIVYTVDLPESSNEYTINVSLSEDSSLITLDETLQPENISTLSTTVYTESIIAEYDVIVGDQVVGGRIMSSVDNATYGYEVEISVEAEEGFIYKVGSLKANGAEVINNRFIMPNEKVTITAEFIKHNYSITTSDTQNGAVRPSKTVAKEGDEITMIATPNTGYKVEGIRVNGVNIQGTTFTMQAEDTVVSAVFTAKDVATYNVYTTQSKNGVIEVNKKEATEGENIEVTAIPKEGYELYQVQVNGEYREGMTFTMPNKNVTVSAEFVVASEKPQVAMPTITATGNKSDSRRAVEITTTTEDAVIYYTTDGTTPTQESSVYKETIQVDKTMTTIQAIAMKEGMKASGVATLEVVITPEVVEPEEVQVAMPTITATGNKSDSRRAVEITTTTEDAVIYYTIDGTTPTQESSVYKETIQVDKTMAIQAIAMKEGMKASSGATLEVVITPEAVEPEEVQVAMPTITATGNKSDSRREVEITTTTEDAVIYYTTDGTTPTQDSSVYKETIQVDKTMITIQAIAMKEGMKASGVATLEVKANKKERSKPSTRGRAPTSPHDKPSYKIYTEGAITKISMEVKAQVDKDIANLTLSQAVLLDAIEAAEKRSFQNEMLDKGIAIDIIVDTPSKTINALQVVLPQGLQETLTKKAIETINIVSDLVKVSLDQDAIHEIYTTIDDELVLRITQVVTSQLSLYTKTFIGDKPVFDLEVKGENNHKFVRLLQKGIITIGIPYTLDASESIEHITAVAIYNGEMVDIADVIYDEATQTIEIKTDYCTRVAISHQLPSVFGDISSHWARNDIEFMSRLGLFGGTELNQFAPDIAMTRGMFVTVLGRLAQIDGEHYATDSMFEDINKKAYYAPYVNWANSKGIVNGITTSTFGANHSITREQVAVMIENYLKYNSMTLPIVREETTFEDHTTISPYAKEAVKRMQMGGIISGKLNNQFDPQGKATRAEIATILKRLIGMIEHAQ